MTQLALLLALALQDADPFPIGVWLQSPRNAGAYKTAGINTYVGLWNGPTAEQLDALKAAGLRVVCAQNAVGLARKDDRSILAWMHGDEPDNAQSAPEGGYGPPILPAKIVEDYAKLRAADPSRPVLLNLGQGVLLHDPELLKVVTGINAQVQALAAVLKSPALEDVATKARFTLKGVEGAAELLDEDRSLPLRDGGFEDELPDYGVRLYRVR